MVREEEEMVREEEEMVRGGGRDGEGRRKRW